MRENFIAIITLKVKHSTKVIVALLMAIPAAVQFPSVKNFLSTVYAAHPKWATTIGGLVALGTLLHSPKIQQALGIDVPEGAKVDATATVTVEDKQ